MTVMPKRADERPAYRPEAPSRATMVRMASRNAPAFFLESACLASTCARVEMVIRGYLKKISQKNVSCDCQFVIGSP